MLKISVFLKRWQKYYYFKKTYKEGWEKQQLFTRNTTILEKPKFRNNKLYMRKYSKVKKILKKNNNFFKDSTNATI